jgi:hypothetical protein
MNNKEVNIFQLFNILYKGRYLILLTPIVLTLIVILYLFYLNLNTSFTGTKKITRHTLDHSEMLKLFKISQNFANIISNTMIAEKYIKSLNFKEKNIMKLFNDNLNEKKIFELAISEIPLNDVQKLEIKHKIDYQEPDEEGTTIHILYEDSKYFNLIINNMTEQAMNKTKEDVRLIVQNDYEYINNFFDETLNNKIVKYNEELSALKIRLNKLKYYFEMAKRLNIENPINQQIHKVYSDFTNEYVRGYKAISIELQNLKKIIADKEKMNSNDNNIITHSKLIEQKLNFLQNIKLENNRILDNFVPVNNNNATIIIANTNYDYIRYGVIFGILGFIFGIIIVLFQYSIREN